MKLDLKHLAPYLPYGLDVKTDKYGVTKLLAVSKIHLYIDFLYYRISYDKVKPILRPLSNFGDSDDTRKVHEFIGLGKWCDFYDEYFRVWFDDLENVDKLILQAPYEIFNYFLANHFDVFGLIEQGLAISIHDLVQAEA
jgi:hypothetical protein